MALIVTSAFGSYVQGQQITDQTTITAILAGPDAGHVVNIGGTVTSSSSTGTSGSTGSVSGGVTLTLSAILTLLATLPTTQPASGGIWWLDNGVLTLSVAVTNVVPLYALTTQSGLPIMTQSGDYITTQ